jgi:hypothetical protein
MRNTLLKKGLASITRIEKQLSAELHTVTKPEEANELFTRLTETIKGGQGIVLIVRNV